MGNLYDLSEEQRRREAAASRYGRLRVTVTFTSNGRADWRIMAKQFSDSWREQHTIAQGSERVGHYPADLDEAAAILGSIVERWRWGGPTG